MYRSIVVPLDGSAFGEQALPFALATARAAGAALCLVHVHREHAFYMVGTVPIVDEVEDARQRTDEKAYLEGLAQRLSAQAPQPVSVALLDQPIASAIAAHAASTHADLIVLTSHGRGGMSRFWLGSTADTLVRQTETPLLIVRPNEARPGKSAEPRLEHILIPLDGSALAEDILDHALALGSLSGARYTLIQAIDPDLVVYASPPAVVRADEQELQLLRAAAREYLDRIAERLRARDAHVQAKIVLGAPAPAILEFAQSHSVDVIAMSTHGRGGVGRLLLGSVADKVIRGASIPLLLHHPRRTPAN
jgi:nucleotide-binding universal stress UspA family protein